MGLRHQSRSFPMAIYMPSLLPKLTRNLAADLIPIDCHFGPDAHALLRSVSFERARACSLPDNHSNHGHPCEEEQSDCRPLLYSAHGSRPCPLSTPVRLGRRRRCPSCQVTGYSAIARFDKVVRLDLDWGKRNGQGQTPLSNHAQARACSVPRFGFCMPTEGLSDSFSRRKSPDGSWSDERISLRDLRDSTRTRVAIPLGPDDSPVTTLTPAQVCMHTSDASERLYMAM